MAGRQENRVESRHHRPYRPRVAHPRQAEMGMREVQSITHDEVQVWVSELAGLQVGDVDFERQRIHVLRTVSEIRDYFVVGTPKTGETRTVIFSPSAQTVP